MASPGAGAAHKELPTHSETWLKKGDGTSSSVGNKCEFAMKIVAKRAKVWFEIPKICDGIGNIKISDRDKSCCRCSFVANDRNQVEIRYDGAEREWVMPFFDCEGGFPPFMLYNKPYNVVGIELNGMSDGDVVVVRWTGVVLLPTDEKNYIGLIFHRPNSLALLPRGKVSMCDLTILPRARDLMRDLTEFSYNNDLMHILAGFFNDIELTNSAPRDAFSSIELASPPCLIELCTDGVCELDFYSREHLMNDVGEWRPQRAKKYPKRLQSCVKTLALLAKATENR